MASPRFTCNCCGLCCKSIGGILQLRRFDRGDGVCRHLTDANLCDIYESRPEVCNVERMYSRFSSEMTKAKYYSMMEASCKYLKNHFCDAGWNEQHRSELEELLAGLPSASLFRLASDIACHVKTFEVRQERIDTVEGRASLTSGS